LLAVHWRDSEENGKRRMYVLCVRRFALWNSVSHTRNPRQQHNYPHILLFLHFFYALLL